MVVSQCTKPRGSHRVARQVLLHHFGVYLHGLLESHHVVGNAVAVGNDSHAVAVSTVAEDKQLVTRLEALPNTASTQ